MAPPSRITMLREISAAGDRERTGALDVEWDGAHASLFFTFGHPSHLVFESADGRTLVGDDALTTLVAELPNEFHVAEWRRAMVTEDTLHLSAEDLVALFQPSASVAANGASAVEDLPDDGDGVDPPDQQPEEPVLTSAEEQATDDLIDDQRLLAGLPAHWRGLRPSGSLPAGWLHTDNLVAEVTKSGRTCALLVDAGEKGAALFEAGELISLYTTERILPTTRGALRGLLDQPDARVTVAGEGIAPPAAQAPATTTTSDDPSRGIPPAPVEEAALSIASSAPEETPQDASETAVDQAEAHGQTPFVPARLDVDIDGLRGELTEIAAVWLGADDSAPVGRALAAARPGVEDFVTTIAAIGVMEIPGHENAVVRAMAREMHYRAAEVLCGV